MIRNSKKKKKLAYSYPSFAAFASEWQEILEGSIAAYLELETSGELPPDKDELKRLNKMFINAIVDPVLEFVQQKNFTELANVQELTLWGKLADQTDIYHHRILRYCNAVIRRAKGHLYNINLGFMVEKCLEEASDQLEFGIYHTIPKPEQAPQEKKKPSKQKSPSRLRSLPSPRPEGWDDVIDFAYENAETQFYYNEEGMPNRFDDLSDEDIAGCVERLGGKVLGAYLPNASAYLPYKTGEKIIARWGAASGGVNAAMFAVACREVFDLKDAIHREGVVGNNEIVVTQHGERIAAKLGKKYGISAEHVYRECCNYVAMLYGVTQCVLYNKTVLEDAFQDAMRSYVSGKNERRATLGMVDADGDVTLLRGITGSVAERFRNSEEFDTRTLESWTDDYRTAERFAKRNGEGIVVAGKIPATDVICYYRSSVTDGVGIVNRGEVEWLTLNRRGKFSPERLEVVFDIASGYRNEEWF